MKKSFALVALLALFISSCGNSGSSISSSDNKLPSFEIGLSDSSSWISHNDLSTNYELNLKSRYTLLLKNNNDEHPQFNECSFKYDEQYLIIIDSISDNQDSHNYVWQIKPLQTTENTVVEIYYHQALCTSFNISIKDLNIDFQSCASTEKELDSVSSSFIEEITVFNDLSTYEDFMSKHLYFGYVKNSPNINTFNEYEYALVRISSYDLGNDPEINSVFIQNGTLYYDFISSKKYYEGNPDVTLTTRQNYYLSLIRYPSGLNVNERSVRISYNYLSD